MASSVRTIDAVARGRPRRSSAPRTRDLRMIDLKPGFLSVDATLIGATGAFRGGRAWVVDPRVEERREDRDEAFADLREVFERKRALIELTVLHSGVEDPGHHSADAAGRRLREGARRRLHRVG